MSSIGMKWNTKESLKQRDVKVKVKTEEDLRKLDTATTNLAGGVAFDIEDPSLRLLYLVGAGFFNEVAFYDRKSGNLELTAGDRALIETAQQIAVRKDGFASDLLKIARYARTELNTRTTPQVLLAVAAHEEATRQYVRSYTPLICKRADEPRVVFAAYQALFGELDVNRGYMRAKSYPKSLLRGLMDALCHYKDGLILKYDDGKHPTFADLLRVVDLDSKGRAHLPGWNEAKWFFLMNHKLPDGRCNACGRLYAGKNIKYTCERKGCEGTIEAFDAEASIPQIAARVKAFRRKEFDKETQRLVKMARLTQEDITSNWGSDTRTWNFVLPSTPYMNLLRNLRNLLAAETKARGKAKTDEEKETTKREGTKMIDTIVRRLTDKKAVANSRQYPYRFWTALHALGLENFYVRNSIHANLWKGMTYGKSDVTGWEKSPYLQQVRDAVLDAAELAVSNVPDLSVNDEAEALTVVAVDLSGSMDNKVSGKSEISCREVAAMFGAIAVKQLSRTLVIAFGETAQVRQVTKRDSLLTLVERIARNEQDSQGLYVGHSTNAHLISSLLEQSDYKIARVILFSDQQFWNNGGQYVYGYRDRKSVV